MTDYFIAFCTNNNYEKIAENLVRSVHEFTNKKIIMYCIDFDEVSYKSKYERLICVRFDWNNAYNIFYIKPKIILETLKNFDVNIVIYCDGDDIIHPSINTLFNSYIDKYPIVAYHSCNTKLKPSKKIMDLIGVKNTYPFCQANTIIFSKNCLNFIEEWDKYCMELGNIGESWDETILNCLLWKYDASEQVIKYSLSIDFTKDLKKLIDNRENNKYYVPWNGCKNYLMGKMYIDVVNDNDVNSDLFKKYEKKVRMIMEMNTELRKIKHQIGIEKYNRKLEENYEKIFGKS